MVNIYHGEPHGLDEGAVICTGFTHPIF